MNPFPDKPRQPPRLLEKYHLTHRRLVWIGVGLLAVIAALWWFTGQHGKNNARATAPLPVVAAAATTGDIDITYTALGTVTPLASVTVQSQISGYLTAVAFKEGQEVKAGDVLAQIDPRPYQAVLDQAEGQLARDQAQLDGARVDLTRYATLMKQDSIAKQTYDDQAATVRQLEGTVQLDQGTVDTARVNLGYCRITAPVSGRLGLRQVDPGNYVTPSQTNGLVLINQMQPISALFSLPEDDLLPILKRTHAGATLPAAAFDRTGVTKLADGNLATVDNTINTTTGTFQLRANFANADEMLYPNQFVNIQLTVDVLKNAIVIPSSAIQRGAPGTFVYLVKPDDTVTVQKVVLGPSQGESQAITSGLAAADLVVTDGADKLKNGAKVSLPTAASPASPAPATPAPAAPAPTSDQAPPAPADGVAPAAAAPDQTPPAPADATQPPANSAPVNLVPANPPQHQH
ncbi:MAG TPA: MdtA/MuxA family multidrug efflux RND transporter periplasmic adaptor subunit, partial [Stellaceae bacterium]|nr:MdtA/MuxA family multidrug efflux RND transporter periplasmic adaptor subunit [Stellaceae bacterium]